MRNITFSTTVQVLIILAASSFVGIFEVISSFHQFKNGIMAGFFGFIAMAMWTIIWYYYTSASLTRLMQYRLLLEVPVNVIKCVVFGFALTVVGMGWQLQIKSIGVPLASLGLAVVLFLVSRWSRAIYHHFIDVVKRRVVRR